jgi:hypothetical protein
MITRVSTIPAITWPSGWEDVEVVDSVLVEEPPPRPAAPDLDTGGYDRFGRRPAATRFGRHVSVLA